ncbi:MAG: ferritin-like domain-containing protein [Gordonia sp. (in: high G+C Gram-positive bacteria)]
MSTNDALAAAADAENAAVFTYGVITAFVAAARRDMLVEFIADHRGARDTVNAAITAGGGTPPVAAAGYTLPQPVTDPVSAAKAALTSEVDCTRAYRALLEQADSGAGRTIGVNGLTASARRAAQWRVVLGQRPATVAFPGAAG